MGADPVACAALAGGADVKAFFVRKEAKQHGLQRRIEGPLLEAGERCLIVEDVVTTGGSTLQAIEAVREAGREIVGVIAILDRLAGGDAIREAAGAPYVRARHDRRHLPGAPGPRLSGAAAGSAPSRIRTCGLLLRRESLYPAELSGPARRGYVGHPLPACSFNRSLRTEAYSAHLASGMGGKAIVERIDTAALTAVSDPNRSRVAACG